MNQLIFMILRALPLSFMAYLVGSIPTGYIFCWSFFGIDITKYGSGNIGATNVARVLGRQRYFFFIFFLDAVKAFLFLLLVSGFLHPTLLLLPAACLLLGNTYSIFLRGKGGKGISTSLGILAYILPSLFFGFLFVWIVFKVGFKRVDIASISATLSLIPQYFLFVQAGSGHLTLLFIFSMVFLVLLRHKNNIRALL